MGIYKCMEDENDYLEVDWVCDSILIQTKHCEHLNKIFLSKEDAQKMANELNQLLMGVKGNE